MSVVFFPSVNHLAFSFGCLHLNPSPFVVWFYGLIIINVEADENIEMKWRDNVRWNRNKRVDPFNHDEHGGKG